MRIALIENTDCMARLVLVDGEWVGNVDFCYSGSAWHRVETRDRKVVGYVKRSLPVEGYTVTVAEMLGAYDRAA